MPPNPFETVRIRNLTLKNMPFSFRAVCVSLGFFLLIGILFNPAVRWSMGIPAVEPKVLANLLAGPNPPMVLDVRSHENFVGGHIPGSRWVPLQSLEGFLSREGLPPGLSLVICDDQGVFPAAAAAAAAWHSGPVFEAADGGNGWEAAGLSLEKGEGRAPPPGPQARPRKELSLLQQAVMSVLGVVLKPAYMLFCLGLILILAKTSALSLRMLFWGLVLFDLGETFCMLDYFFCPSGFLIIAPLDLVHGAGMVGLGCLGPWAFYRMFEERMGGTRPDPHTNPAGNPERAAEAPQHSHRPGVQTVGVGHAGSGMPGGCLFRGFCGSCMVSQKTRCSFLRVLLLLFPALGALALLPLSLPLRPVHYTSFVFQSSLECGFPILNEFVELYGYAIMGGLSFLIAGFILWKGEPGFGRKMELPFFLGVGFASFALFRFMLHTAFHETFFWSNFWEEISELFAIFGIGWFLFVFRNTLGLNPDTRSEAGTA